MEEKELSIWFKIGEEEDFVLISGDSNVATLREKINERLKLTTAPIKLKLKLEGKLLTNFKQQVKNLDLKENYITVEAPPQTPEQQKVQTVPSKKLQFIYHKKTIGDITFLHPLIVGARNKIFLIMYQNTQLIAKVADCWNQKNLVKELLHESSIYNLLRELQGEVIPNLKYSNYLYCIFILATDICGTSLDKCSLNSLDLEKVKNQALDGLKRIHSYGVLHGDLRFQNILWNSETQKVFWIDFGFSKEQASEEELKKEDEELEALFL